MQRDFDKLYKQSGNRKHFKNLMEIITSESNIRLAFRNIKSNTGSNTVGIDGKTIADFKDENVETYVRYIQRRLKNYKPQEVRRVHIPKGGTGKTRPLGIPTMGDRLIQQSIKQILEPICEAKFYNHSYGFRPNRSTKHALARMYYLINKAGLNYCVDIDIKGFFDNVNHAKLLKQIWSLGIRDKSLISIISKMLKAPIDSEGIPEKGTPQGGILSPLLSNIVLNELDWWVSSQWETKKTQHNYTQKNKYTAMKKSYLKEIYIVRYADDFKIMCRTKKMAQKAYIAVKQWLKDRLGLEVSEEKSKIVNLKSQYSEFLGFKIKSREKNNKRVVISHLSDKVTKKIINNLKEQIKRMKKSPTAKQANRFNSMVLGLHNYYNTATHVNINFSKTGYNLSKSIFNQLRKTSSNSGKKKSDTFIKYYGDYNFKTTYVAGIALFPISGIKTKPPMSFSQDICDYTVGGRAKIHTKLTTVDIRILRYLMEHPIQGQSNEYNDNRISLYTGQGGVCRITKLPLRNGEMEVHHQKPKELGGDDSYKNLAYIHSNIHKMIHCVKETVYNKYLEKMLAEYVRQNYNQFEKENREELIENLREKWHKGIWKFRKKAENFGLN